MWIIINDFQWWGKWPRVILLQIVEGISDIKEQFEVGINPLVKMGAPSLCENYDS